MIPEMINKNAYSLIGKALDGVEALFGCAQTLLKITKMDNKSRAFNMDK